MNFGAKYKLKLSCHCLVEKYNHDEWWSRAWSKSNHLTETFVAWYIETLKKYSSRYICFGVNKKKNQKYWKYWKPAFVDWIKYELKSLTFYVFTRNVAKLDSKWFDPKQLIFEFDLKIIKANLDLNHVQNSKLVNMRFI